MTSRDITAQKLAEEKLSEANARLEAVLDHSPMAIYMRDLDQRWIVANAETCAIMGKRPEELIGRPMAEAFEPELFEELAANDRRVMRGGVAVSFDETVPDARTSDTTPRLVAQVPDPRRRGRGRRPRRRLARRDRSRARRPRARRGPRALRADVHLGARRHAREPRRMPTAPPRSSSATRRSPACSDATRPICSGAAAAAIVHPDDMTGAAAHARRGARRPGGLGRAPPQAPGRARHLRPRGRDH